KLGGAALKPAYISNHYSADNPAPEIQNFVKAYQAKFNVAPDSLAALAYDSAKVLADAIKRAGGTDSAKLKEAINQTKNFAGVTGTITLDASRNAVKSAVVLSLDPAGSKFAFKETIYPEGMTPPTTTTANTNTDANAMTANANTNTTNSNANMNSTANTNTANSTSANTNTTR
ncbi:MAG TPA: ABC transporter substrate-binding protein, partial [Pyrinomonadaceae bacterium]